MPNFVESGHSHMESDSMQSAIEREKRHADVGLGSDISSGSTQKPIQSFYYHHEDLYNFQELAQRLLTNKCCVTDGNMVKWLSVKNFKYGS